LVLRNGISEPPVAGRRVDPATYRDWYHRMLKREGVPFWPDTAWRDTLFGVCLIGFIMALALIFGPPELTKPPDPSILQADPRPDWYFLWYFAVLALMPHGLEQYVIVLGPLIFGVLLCLVPFFRAGDERSPARRPWAVGVALATALMIARFPGAGSGILPAPGIRAIFPARNRRKTVYSDSFSRKGKQERRCLSMVPTALDRLPAADAPPGPDAARSAGAKPDAPPGWSYNPSSWPQRLPVIALALANCGLAAYLAACQIANSPAWDPIFGSGTTRVLQSSVARSFPISDAALGAAAYLLEALSGSLGGPQRWRTHPWLVLTFGVLVVPLSVVSIVLMILQPVVVHAWCTLCLVAAAFMLVMVPLALDEVVAVFQFLARSVREGKPLWTVFWHGDSPAKDERQAGADKTPARPLEGLTIPWNIAVLVGLGIWLLLAPAVLDSEGPGANSCFVTGAMVLAINMLALAEVARPVRFLTALCGVWLMVGAPWSLWDVATGMKLNEVAVGAALIFLSFPPGRLSARH
ncbi:MAG TPA: vitamin K epoxide reductase family protein, partial [Chthonomonadaceae bacterium]|nr:vitamin K epoxide reductase family protein [Chthonomonadaceae bacterium]